MMGKRVVVGLGVRCEREGSDGGERGWVANGSWDELRVGKGLVSLWDSSFSFLTLGYQQSAHWMIVNVNIRLNVVKALLVCNVVSVMLTMKNNVVGVAGKT
ncbi:hypothetical protein Pyn_22537 [Prunus yedoensis var. nudiflora]|uniref:Uncharacterized protein n=1 Tax=Prunus yedoensis var. nudiflora TaxID=2094558 RepID=A0A314ZK02_PRUYE|nr:hypothetical protein Pyn_22537 [Prunus yedoensis var. nudiflora]